MLFGRPLFRFVRKETHINFMRGRYIGLITSAVLSIASLILFFYPGLTLGLDFRGGVVVEAKTTTAIDFSQLRAVLKSHGIQHASLQSFGSDRDGSVDRLSLLLYGIFCAEARSHRRR